MVGLRAEHRDTIVRSERRSLFHGGTVNRENDGLQIAPVLGKVDTVPLDKVPRELVGPPSSAGEAPLSAVDRVKSEFLPPPPQTPLHRETMRHSRTFLLIALSLLLAFELIACGDDGGDETTDTTQAEDTYLGTDTVVPSDTTVLSDTTVQNDTTVPDDVVEPAPTTLVINEIVVMPLADEAIELYNYGDEDVSLLGWTFTQSNPFPPDDSYTVTSDVTISAGGFILLTKADVSTTADDSVFSDVGAKVSLFAPDDALIDSFSYGVGGRAPTPVDGWSVGRITDGLDTNDDAVDFNVDSTPTMGAANDIPAVSLGGSDIIINEFSVDITTNTEDFVELYNRSNAAIDIAGWTLVHAGAAYTFSSTSVDTHGFVLLTEAEFPADAVPAIKGEVYLLDDAGVRYQGISWSRITITGGVSYGLYPDGQAAAYAGDFETGGLIIMSTPTPGVANVE